MSIVEKTTFAALVAGRAAEFPTLARAAANTMAAHNPKIEWLVNNDGQLETNGNYTQIFREPYIAPFPEADNYAAYSDVIDGAVTKFLAAVEATLLHGVRGYKISPPSSMRWCGGIRDLLGRDLCDTDALTLRVLREPRLRMTDHNAATGEYYDAGRYEWIAETSLQAVTAEQSRIPAREEAIA